MENVEQLLVYVAGVFYFAHITSSGLYGSEGTITSHLNASTRIMSELSLDQKSFVSFHICYSLALL